MYSNTGNRPLSSSQNMRPHTAKTPTRTMPSTQQYPASNLQFKLKKRHIPRHFHKDPEQMYLELQQLKQQITGLETENLKLKTQVQKVEQGREKKERQVEELLKAHAIVETKGRKYESLFKEVSLLKRLKQRVRELEAELQQRDEEFDRIRLDSRYTRVRELETEMKTYYAESRRLQTLVDQMHMEHEQMMNNIAAQGMGNAPQNFVNTVELQQLREKNAKFRDLVMKMKQMQDHLKEQNDILSDQLRQYQDGEAPNPIDNTQELQHLKNENERLLHQREKLRADHAQLLEQSKSSNNELADLNRTLKRTQAQLKDTEENFETYKTESEEHKTQLVQRIQQLEARVEELEEETEKARSFEPRVASPEPSAKAVATVTPQKRASVLSDTQVASSPRRNTPPAQQRPGVSPTTRRQSSQLASPVGSRRQSAISQTGGKRSSLADSDGTPVRRASNTSQLSAGRQTTSTPRSALKADKMPEPTRSNSPLLGDDEEEDMEEEDSVIDPETENATDEDDMNVHDEHVAEIPNSRKFAFEDDDDEVDPFEEEERERAAVKSAPAKRTSTVSASGAGTKTAKSSMQAAMDAADTASDPFETPRDDAFNDDDDDSFDREMEREFGGGDDFLDDDLEEDEDDNDNYLG